MNQLQFTLSKCRLIFHVIYRLYFLLWSKLIQNPNQPTKYYTHSLFNPTKACQMQCQHRRRRGRVTEAGLFPYMAVYSEMIHTQQFPLPLLCVLCVLAAHHPTYLCVCVVVWQKLSHSGSSTQRQKKIETTGIHPTL
jgi:hypothetical protein